MLIPSDPQSLKRSSNECSTSSTERCVRPCVLASGRASSCSVDEFECAICCEVLVDPCVGICGHDFCRVCIKEWRLKCPLAPGQSGLPCPLCRQELLPAGSDELGVSHRLKSIVERLFPHHVAKRREEQHQQQAANALRKQAAFELQMASIRRTLRSIHSELFATTVPSCPPSAPSAPPITHSSGAASVSHAAPASSSTSVAALAARGSPAHWGSPSPQPPPATDPSPCSLSWHTPSSDTAMRQGISRLLMTILQRRRPHMADDFRQRLPMFVSRLETDLYRTSPSRQHYADMSTLPQRMRHVAQQAMALRQRAQ